MGEPTECEHPNSANGDTLQATTTGLAFYRKSTNTPTFTDGFRHWGLTSSGLVYWEGDSIDPPVLVAPSTPDTSSRTICYDLAGTLPNKDWVERSQLEAFHLYNIEPSPNSQGHNIRGQYKTSDARRQFEVHGYLTGDAVLLEVYQGNTLWLVYDMTIQQGGHVMTGTAENKHLGMSYPVQFTKEGGVRPFC